MKKYIFTNGSYNLGVKAHNFEAAVRLANQFMDGAACIGWGPCRG